MAKYLFIVESPAKAKTINKYLGSDYKVLSSFGHMFELEGKGKGVNTQEQFKLNKHLTSSKKPQMDAIMAAAKAADVIYLASDPDREGEGIANDILTYLRSKKIDKPIKRVTYHEVTEKAVKEAVANAGHVNLEMAEAQNARRGLDYLVGFNLSPLLWRSVGNGTSAGRVQSPGLRLVCERAAEIKAFIPVKYSQFDAIISGKDIEPGTKAQFNRYQDKTSYKLLPDSPIYQAYSGDLDRLEKDLKGITELVVKEITQKPNTRKPSAPFITSTLQQAAHSRLGFSVDSTMSCAQKLFEKGFITYHRTDSVTLSKDSIESMREYILTTFGKDYLHTEVRQYKGKAANAQEAHEAIRPTDWKRQYQEVEQELGEREAKLYRLIYNRTIASQMSDAKTLVTTIRLTDTQSGDYGCRLSGSVVTFDGFTKVYAAEKKDDEGKVLPPLKVGDIVKVAQWLRENKETEPPARYNDASLVKALEDKGIGRPSTYASIIKTLKDREYIIKEGNGFEVTDKGVLVNRYLTTNMPRYVDIAFTAEMENRLDAIAHGKLSYLQAMSEYWDNLSRDIKEAKEKTADTSSPANQTKVLERVEGKSCPTCGKGIVKRLGRFGAFMACEDYPTCKTILKEGGTVTPAEPTGRQCPQCSKDLVKKVSRNGNPFISCTGYPKCKYVEWIDNTPESERVTCPYCKTGYLKERQMRFGKAYSCSRYPECDSGFIKESDFQTLKAGGTIELTTPEERAARKAAWQAKFGKGVKKGKGKKKA